MARQVEHLKRRQIRAWKDLIVTVYARPEELAAFLQYSLGFDLDTPATGNGDAPAVGIGDTPSQENGYCAAVMALIEHHDDTWQADRLLEEMRHDHPRHRDFAKLETDLVVSGVFTSLGVAP